MLARCLVCSTSVAFQQKDNIMHILAYRAPRTLAVCSLVTLSLASTALQTVARGHDEPHSPSFDTPSTTGNSSFVSVRPADRPRHHLAARLHERAVQQRQRHANRLCPAEYSAARRLAYSGALMFDHTGALGVFQGFNNLTKEYRINNVGSGGTIHFLQGGATRSIVNARAISASAHLAPGAKLEIGSITSGWSTAGWGRALELANASVVKWRSNGTTRFGIGQTAQGLFFINANSDDTSATPSYPLSILNNGTVGIGTSTPTQAKVVIDGFAGNFNAFFGRLMTPLLDFSSRTLAAVPYRTHQSMLLTHISALAFYRLLRRADQAHRRALRRGARSGDAQWYSSHGLRLYRHHRQRHGKRRRSSRSRSRRYFRKP